MLRSLGRATKGVGANVEELQALHAALAKVTLLQYTGLLWSPVAAAWSCRSASAGLCT